MGKQKTRKQKKRRRDEFKLIGLPKAEKGNRYLIIKTSRKNKFIVRKLYRRY